MILASNIYSLENAIKITAIKICVSIHWTGLLDRTTGLKAFFFPDLTTDIFNLYINHIQGTCQIFIKNYTKTVLSS